MEDLLKKTLIAFDGLTAYAVITEIKRSEDIPQTIFCSKKLINFVVILL